MNRTLTVYSLTLSYHSDPVQVNRLAPYSDDGVFFGIGQEMQPLDYYFLGQDPRMILLDENSVLVAYTNRYVKQTTSRTSTRRARCSAVVFAPVH